MVYDALNRVTVVSDLYGQTLTYTYDEAWNLTKVQDSKGGVTTSTYDNADRLIKREFGGSGQTPLRFDLTYTVRDQVETESRYSDLAGTTKIGETDYAYDDGGRVKNIKHIDAVGLTQINLTYTYDGAERLWTETRDGSTRTFTYGVADQLTNDGTTAYSYDAAGNRNMAGYATGTGNRMSNDGTWTYTYDVEGNLTKKSKGASAETWTYGYDNRNQMTSVEQRATDGGTLQLKGTYTYDVYGDRIQEEIWKSSTGTTATTRFVYDDQDVWAD